MSENSENAPEKVEFTPIGYVENDYFKPEYKEEVYEKVSKIVLREDLVDGLYRVEELEKLYMKVVGNVLYVKGLDAINGTPVLDIKPYMKDLEEKEKENTK